MRVCKNAGFNKRTGYLYWKMFFTVLFKNPKGIEPAVNLAAMYIHFETQKKYIVSLMNILIQEIEIESEAKFYERMFGSTAPNLAEISVN
jgi:hypothetical protein